MRRAVGTLKSKKGLDTSSLPNILFTLLLCAACWAIGYNYEIGYPVRGGSGTSLLWHVISENLPDRDYLYPAGFALLFLGASLLQRFNFYFVIIKGKTTHPFLFFLLLNSVNPDFYPIRPVSIAFFLLLFALFELFASYQNPRATGRMFNMMVFVSAGSLVWPYLLWLIPVFGIGMYKFRILNIKTLAASLLGIFTVYWFVLSWCVWRDDYAVFTNIAQCLTEMHIIFYKELWQTELLAPLCAFIVMITLSIHISLQEFENTIRSRHFLSFLFIFGVFAFVLSLAYSPIFVDFMCVFYLPVSIIASYFFSGKPGIISFLFYYFLVALLVFLLFMRLWNFL